MRILGMADLHGQVERLIPIVGLDVDLIAFLGDLYNLGSPKDALPVVRALAELGAPVLIVPGNMDSREFAIQLWEKEGLIVLHHRSHRFRDTGFIGMGGIVARDPRRLGDPGRFYHSEDDVGPALAKAFSDIAGCQRKVLLTHQPPHGILDITYDGVVTGSLGLRRFIEVFEPDLHICGHIHEAQGVARLGPTTIVNVGEMRMGYSALIEIDEDMMGGDIKVIWIGPGVRSP